ncbi:MAG: NAD-dependent epimerase/dehydratase family protein [Candidatus Heimdallarchaeota archaeon]|nr:NAD-dependent epimerase/dehydratase family protein [Candidatus Heimdallarchaeota archaeon]
MTSKEQTVLITGGLGQVGYFLYKTLRDNYKICILDNETEAKYKAPTDVEFHKGDIRDAEVYNSLPAIDYIIHCAAQISINKSVEDPISDAEVNILGTLKLLDFARSNGIRKFVYLSSAATIGVPHFLPITEEHPRNPISPYGFSKYTAERYVLLYSDLYELNSVVILPFNLYSTLQKEDDPYAGVIYKFISAVLRDLPPSIEGDGEQTRDFIHAKDVATAIKLALEQDTGIQRVFNIGSGKGTSILELAELIIKISGKDLKPNYVDARIGDIKESYCSIEKASGILGFKPSIKFEDGVKELYNHIKSSISP